MSEASVKAVDVEIEKIVAKNITAEEDVSTLPVSKITEDEEVAAVKKDLEVREVVEEKKVAAVIEVAEAKEVSDIVESDVKKTTEVKENIIEEPAVSQTPNPIDLKQLGLTVSDESGLADVIDDFDNALTLKTNEENGNNSLNELQQIQSVQSHLSAG